MKCAKDSGKNWRTRYFVLTANSLNYYLSSKHLRKPKGNVLLVSDAKVTAENVEVTKQMMAKSKSGAEKTKFYGFRLSTPFESILFLTPMESERKSWMDALKDAIANAHASLRGYMMNRKSAMGWEKTSRKFWILHKDTLTYHKDHEHTKVDEFAYTIEDDTEIDPDDDKLKLKINDPKGKRVVTIQFEDRTAHEYPLWRDALLDVRDRHEIEEQEFQEHVEDVMSEAVQQDTLEVLGQDGELHSSTVAFTPTEVVIQEEEEDGGTHAVFYELTASSKIILLDEKDTGRPFVFQLTVENDSVQIQAKNEEQLNEWKAAIEKIIPPKPRADDKAVLLRAARQEFEKQVPYEVVIAEKKALGLVFAPYGHWAVIKEYGGYDSSHTGVEGGSLLTAINGVNVLFNEFGDTTSMLKAEFEKTEPLTLEFRHPPIKTGVLLKKSATKKNGESHWTERTFSIKSNKLIVQALDGEGADIGIPIKNAEVTLVEYNQYLMANCFKVDVGELHLVMQAESTESMLNWAATLKFAVAIASGGGYVYDYLAENYEKQTVFEETLSAFPEELDEASTNAIMAVGAAFTNKDVGELEASLTAAYELPAVVEHGTDFLEVATAQLNELYELHHALETDLLSLESVVMPDPEQQKIIDERLNMEAMSDMMDGGLNDSDDEDGGHMRGTIGFRGSLIGSSMKGLMSTDELSFEEAEDNAAELAHMRELEKLEEPDAEKMGECATDEEIAAVYGFYAKLSDPTNPESDLTMNVMNFCTVWRMVGDASAKGNLMAQMKMFNTFDEDGNGYLLVDNFIKGVLDYSKSQRSNKMLIKMHALVDGGALML